MLRCPSCQEPLTATGRFCPACGADCAAAGAGDVTIDAAATVAATATPASSPSRPVGDGRFVPGAMIGDRYRIVGLLGRGGMGEVYRADDLKLGQAVALKFLPPGLDANPDRLSRFLGEVRTARQVTHANVCRVFDVEESGGQHFLTMEYVDGEDLASLLLRVGRLPQERAVEVARQICAGLAAAHEQGILHRDLKPANVMIDGRGRVRLTDFGLAGLADEIDSTEIASGTPAYMAPEQIAGSEVGVRSDLYALGLVLYEMFTGRRTFEAESLAEMQRLHTTAPPSNLSTHVKDLDPAVERVVLHCLEKNPADRPPSALAVSAALPGGDPLAAALAAGETPSPELVAEVGERRGMAPGRAILLAAIGLALLVGGTRWGGSLTITSHLPLERRPEVLEDRARTIIADLGYTEDVYARPADSTWGLLAWWGVINEVAAADTTGDLRTALGARPDALSYWYRQSPRVILPEANNPPLMLRGAVSVTNPAMITSGEVTVLLDAAGHLRRFEVMPPRYSLVDTVGEPDWSRLFELADLDPARFEEDRPRYMRFMAPDRRRGWTGTHADRPEVPIRVEAGSFEGRPVLFNVATLAGMEALGTPPATPAMNTTRFLDLHLQPILFLTVIAASIFMSRRNSGQHRADQRGAVRFASALAVLTLIAGILGSHAMFTEQWGNEIWTIIVASSFIGLSIWSLYTAIEPLGRRVAPVFFVSSSRLLSRPRIEWLDPLIGTSVLAGVIGGAASALVQGPLRQVARPLWTDGNPVPLGFNTEVLRGARATLGSILDVSLLMAFIMMLVVVAVLARRLVRRRVPAVALTLLVWSILQGAGGPETMIFNLLISTVDLVLLLRWGVVSMVVGRIVMMFAWNARSADWSAWHAEGPLLVLFALALMTAYGAWAAVGRSRSVRS